MIDDRYHLRFRFDWGCSSCLWAGGAGRSYNGITSGTIEPEALPLTDATRAEIAALAAHYQGALNWDYPPDPSPWSAAEWGAFERAADRLLLRIQRELGDQFVIDDGRRK